MNPVPTTIQTTKGHGHGVNVVAGLYPGEDPSNLSLWVGDVELNTVATPHGYDKKERPDNVRLRAEVPAELKGTVDIRQRVKTFDPPEERFVDGLIFQCESPDGSAEFDLLPGHDLDTSLPVYEALSANSIEGHGALEAQAEVWANGRIRLQLAWSTSDCATPCPSLLNLSAFILNADDLQCAPKHAYPGLSTETGRVILGENQSLKMMSGKTWRLTFAPEGVSTSVVDGNPEPGGPRSVSATDGSRLSVYGIEHPLPTIEHLGGTEEVRKRVAARALAYGMALADGNQLPGEPTPELDHIHGWTRTWHARTGGPTSGNGIDCYPYIEEALAGGMTAASFLRMQCFATEGRGLGILTWHGELLDTYSPPNDPDYPKDLKPGHLRYGMNRSSGNVHARNWNKSGGGDRFGFFDVEKRTGAAAEEWANIDTMHLVLAFGPRLVLHALTGDWLAGRELQGLANSCRLEKAYGEGKFAALTGALNQAKGKPGQGLQGGRADGWAVRVVAEAARFSPPQTAARVNHIHWLGFELETIGTAYMTELASFQNSLSNNYGNHVTPPKDPDASGTYGKDKYGRWERDKPLHRVQQGWENELLFAAAATAITCVRLRTDIAQKAAQMVMRQPVMRDQFWVEHLGSWFTYRSPAAGDGVPYRPHEIPIRGYSWKMKGTDGYQFPGGLVYLSADADKPLDWDDFEPDERGAPSLDTHYQLAAYAAAALIAYRRGHMHHLRHACAGVQRWMDSSGVGAWQFLTQNRGWGTLGMDAGWIYALEALTPEGVEKLAEAWGSDDEAPEALDAPGLQSAVDA